MVAGKKFTPCMASLKQAIDYAIFFSANYRESTMITASSCSRWQLSHAGWYPSINLGAIRLPTDGSNLGKSQLNRLRFNPSMAISVCNDSVPMAAHRIWNIFFFPIYRTCTKNSWDLISCYKEQLKLVVICVPDKET